VTGDSKPSASSFKKRNRQERDLLQKGRGGFQQGLAFDAPTIAGYDALAEGHRALDAAPDGSVAEVHRKAARYEQLRLDAHDRRTLYNLWTAAFFLPLEDSSDRTVPTTRDVASFAHSPSAAYGPMVGRANSLAASKEMRFFHWEMEFPVVFEQGGFDVVIGNPPWDIVQADETADETIGFQKQKNWFKLHQYSVLKGRRDLYKLFIAQFRNLTNLSGRLGFVVPLGMFVEDDSAEFRRELFLKGSVVRLAHFQNHRKQFFSDVHASYRFVTIVHAREPKYEHEFSTVARLPEEMPSVYWVRIERPNIATELGADCAAALFNNEPHYTLHRALMQRLQDRATLKFNVVAEFHATSDGKLLSKERQNTSDWRLLKNQSIHQFNYQFAEADRYVSKQTVRDRCIQKNLNPDLWLDGSNRLLFRDIARNDDARTLICCLAPQGFVSSYDTPMVVPGTSNKEELRGELDYMCGIFNSFTFDFLIRPFVDKHVKGYVLKRVPVPAYRPHDALIISLADCSKALTQMYIGATNPEPLALAELKATLEANVARLVGLSADAVDFIFETFPIVRDDEVRVHGSYKTKELALVKLAEDPKSSRHSGERGMAMPSVDVPVRRQDNTNQSDGTKVVASMPSVPAEPTTLPAPAPARPTASASAPTKPATPAPQASRPQFPRPTPPGQSSFVEPFAPAPASFQVGDRVRHAIFGEGRVTEVVPRGNDLELGVAFDTAGRKRLMASMAKLEKLEKL
jgi:hypothetical protein